MWKGMLVAATVVGLSGCSSVNQAMVGEPTEPAPVNYREIVLEGVKQFYFDPYSVRDAQLSAPQWLGSWNIGQGNGWVVCVRANAKNRMGAYTGMQDSALFIRGGKVIDLLTDLPAGGAYYCGSAVYSPFPELDALRSS